MQNKAVIADSQLSDGSHYYNIADCAAVHGRLFGTTGATAWCGGYDSDQLTSGKLLK